MPLKSQDKEESPKPAPLRRSLRLSSCSPTPSGVLTRSRVSESPEPRKITRSKTLSFTEKSKKEDNSAPKRLTRRTSTETNKDATDIKENIKENVSSEEDNVKNISSDEKKTRSRPTYLEQIAEVDEEDQTTKKATRSRNNLLVESVTNGQKGEEKSLDTETKREFPVVILTPIKEICDSKTPLAVNDEKINKIKSDECDREVQIINNKENIGPEKEYSKVVSFNENSSRDFSSVNMSPVKSESETFSIASDTSTPDVENKTSAESNSFSNNENSAVDNEIDPNKLPPNSENVKHEAGGPTDNGDGKKHSDTSDEPVAVEENSSQQKDRSVHESEEHVDKANLNDPSPIHSVSDELTTKIKANTLQGKGSKECESEPEPQTHREKINDSPSIQSSLNDSNSLDIQHLSNVDTKIDNLLKEHNVFDSEEDVEEHPFLDTMAEEGEEDTPSEGSNDIIEIGIEINTTESDVSTDQSYDKDSFIDDEEEYLALLSGDEYDLSLSPKKKTRIIELSSGSDDDIVRIKRVKKEKPKKRKKSRIVKFSVSSEDEAAFDDVKESEPQPKKEMKEENNVTRDNNEDGENEEKVVAENDKEIMKCKADSPQNTSNENTLDVIKEVAIEVKDPQIKDDTQTKDTVEKIESCNSDLTTVSVVSENNLCDNSASLIECNDNHSSKQKIIVLENITFQNVKDDRDTVKLVSSTPKNTFNEKKSSPEQKVSDNNDTSLGTSSSFTKGNDTSTTKLRKKVIVIKNISLQDVGDKDLSDHIKELIDCLSPDIKNANEVSINVSLNYPVQEKSPDAHRDTEGFQDQDMKETEHSVRVDDVVPENRSLEKHQAVIKEKRRKRKRKTSKTDKLDVTTASKKKKKNSQNLVNDVRVSSDNDIVRAQQMLKDNTESVKETQDNIPKNKRRRKRKHTKKEIFPSIANSEPEPRLLTIQKKKKIKPSTKPKPIYEETESSSGIVKAALLDDQKKKLMMPAAGLLQNNVWNIKSTVIKPSVKATHKPENKTVQCSTSEDTNKFHPKDFKNRMLFDPKHVKRIDTKQALKRKMF